MLFNIFFLILFCGNGGATQIHNAVLIKKSVVVQVLFFSLEHEYPWKYHMSSIFSVLLPSGKTLHYHPDDCLESYNMDFISA